MTDEDAEVMMPHAIRLAAAVAYRDEDATQIALHRALTNAPGYGEEPWQALVMCLADLVTAAEGAHLRALVRTHKSTADTIAALDMA